MPKTIAQLRTSPDVGQAESVFPVCLNGKLTARLQVLLAELQQLRFELDQLPRADPDKPDTSRRMTDIDPRPAKQAEVDAKHAEAEAVRAQMEEDLVEVLLRTKPSGEWMEWEATHPPREGSADDMRIGSNFDALLVALPEWIAAVSGEPMAPGDSEWLMATANHGDLKEMVATVARMQNGGISVPKSLIAWRSDPESELD